MFSGIWFPRWGSDLTNGRVTTLREGGAEYQHNEGKNGRRAGKIRRMRPPAFAVPRRPGRPGGRSMEANAQMEAKFKWMSQAPINGSISPIASANQNEMDHVPRSLPSPGRLADSVHGTEARACTHLTLFSTTSAGSIANSMSLTSTKRKILILNAAGRVSARSRNIRDNQSRDIGSGGRIRRCGRQLIIRQAATPGKFGWKTSPLIARRINVK